MNKNELAAAVASKTNMTKANATAAVEAMLEAVAESLRRGEEVRLIGFGTFSVASRKATTGRNPRTGETIQIKATKLPKFKPGKGLKDTVAA